MNRRRPGLQVALEPGILLLQFGDFPFRLAEFAPQPIIVVLQAIIVVPQALDPPAQSFKQGGTAPGASPGEGEASE